MVYVKQMPPTIKLTTILYFSSSLLYTCVGSYFDSKQYLEKFRNNELKENDLIKSEWDAVQYGSKVNFAERFFSSLIWPYSITKNIIPSLVLFLNKKKE